MLILLGAKSNDKDVCLLLVDVHGFLRRFIAAIFTLSKLKMGRNIILSLSFSQGFSKITFKQNIPEPEKVSPSEINFCN